MKKVEKSILFWSLVLLVMWCILPMVTMAANTLKITQQPVSVTVGEGQTAKAMVVASGDGLSYQWYCTDNASDSTFSKSSIKESTYATTMKEEKSGRKIYCVVTDKYGNTVKSNTVTLSMGTKLRITQQPVSVTVGEGQTAKATVVATGDGLSYQWYCTDNASDSTFSKSSIKESAYATTMKEEKSGRKIYCVVTDKYGNTVKSNTVTLNMGTKLRITQQPVSVKVGEGQTAKATVVASGDDLSYQWYCTDNASDSTFSKSSIKESAYATTMKEEKSGRKIYCVVTDKYGNTVKSNTVTLNMGTKLRITQQPVSVTVAEGETIYISVTATGDGLKYQWYYNNSGQDNTFYKSGIKKETYETVMNEARSGRRIYCVVTDQYGNTVKSDTVTLKLKKPLVITTQPKNTKAKINEEVILSVEVSGGEAPYTYQWQFANRNFEGYCALDILDGTTYKHDYLRIEGGDSDKLTILVHGAEFWDEYRFRCEITDATGCSVISNWVILEEKREAYIWKEPYNKMVMEGEKAKTTVEATGDGLTYQWYYTQNANDDIFKKSSITTATYSITMEAAKDGRKVYCVITDAYNNQVTTRVATLVMETDSYNREFMQEVVRLVNIEREKEGLNPLVMEEDLQSAAMVRAKELDEYYSHTRPDGNICFSVLNDFGIGYWYGGENIAMGHTTPSWVVEAWMNSEGHRANILKPEFNKIGVGHYQNSTGYDHWCQLFTS